MKEMCMVNVTGLYPAGGDNHWIRGFWYGHIEDGKMIVSILESDAYTEFSEDWMPDGFTRGVMVKAPIEAVRLTVLQPN